MIDCGLAEKQRETLNQTDDHPTRAADPVEAFRRAIANAGICPPKNVIPNEWLRWGKKKQFWAIFHDDGVPAGAFGDHKSQLSSRWCSKKRSDLTPAERQQLDEYQELARQKRKKENALRHTRAAEKAREIYRRGTAPDADHQYLVSKGVPAHEGVRQLGNALVIPVSNSNDDLISLQFVYSDGKKRFQTDGEVKSGRFVIVGGPEIYITEGYATAATVNEATGGTVICSFNAGNLKPVAMAIRAQHPATRITICADNDQFTVHHSGRINPGLIEARAAAQAICACLAVPIFKNYRGKPTDFNDLAAREGLDVVKQQIGMAKEASSDHTVFEPADIKRCLRVQPQKKPWFITDRFPLGRGLLVTGLGGSSKTRLLYHLAVGAILGRLPWGWQIERTGKALLCLTEDTQDDVHQTLFYMARGLALDDAEQMALMSKLVIFPTAGKELTFLKKTTTGTVERSPQFQELVDYIQKLGNVVLVGIDPALSVSEGDELDQNHQRQLGKMVDDLAIITGATSILASHATKASLNEEELTSHSSRGGGAITDAVRGEYTMRNMTRKEANQAGITEVEERKRHVQLVATKGNALPPAAYTPVWLRRDDTGSLFGVGISIENGTLSPRDYEILSVHAEIDRISTPTIAEWRQKCIEKGLITGVNENAKNQAMKRACDRLKKAGFIEKGIGKGVWKSTGQTG